VINPSTTPALVAPTAPPSPSPGPAYDVLVAGAGPSGTVASLLLAEAGLRVGVVEARGPSGTRANVVQLGRQSLEVLEHTGMADGLRGAWPEQPDELGRHHSIASIENAGRGRFGAAGSEAHYGTPVTAATSTPDGVAVAVRDAATGAEHVVSARYLLNTTGGRLGENKVTLQAADGSTSVVDIAPVVVSDLNRLVIQRYPYQPHTPKGSHFRTGSVVDPATGERRRVKFNVMQNPRDGAIAVSKQPPWSTADSDEGVRDLFTTAQIDGGGGVAAMQADLGPVGAPTVVPHRHQVAPTARVGNVISLGDAVTRVDTRTGWGTNAGIEDALRAARAVISAIRDPGGAEAVLDTYNRHTMQRHADWLAHSIEAYAGGLATAREQFPEGMAIVDRWSSIADPATPPPSVDPTQPPVGTRNP
jgi:FAD binding domain